MPEKIILTGSSGFVGKHLLTKLLEFGYSVTELDIVKGIDITDWKQVNNFKGFDQVIHLAARTYVPDSFKNPRDFFDVNINGTLNMLELARLNEAKFIMASSFVYGQPEYLPIDEKHPVKSLNPYADSKILAEQICTGYNRHFGVPVIILRPFNLFGSGQNVNFLVPSIIEQSEKNEIILHDPEPRRDMLFVDDMVNAYINCVKLPGFNFEIFNIGYGLSYSVRDITEMIVGCIGRKINIKFSGDKRKNEIMDAVADISKAREKLNWQPKVSFVDGINKMLGK